MNKSKDKPHKHHSHLSFADRVLINDWLRRGESFRAIALYLQKSPTTIAREVKTHAQTVKSKGNDCINRRDCNHKAVCPKPNCSSTLCKRCKIPCKKYCPDYSKAYCEKLLLPPYVCNGCTNEHYCNYEQRIYNPKTAESEYRDMLVNRRNGFDLSYEQIVLIDEMVSPLIYNGLSPYHIKQTYGDKLPVSEATLRKLIAQGELNARNINLRDQVKRRPRKKSTQKLHNETLSVLKIGHKYEDYLQYMSTHDTYAVQMDCVEGKKEDSAVLLTLHFPQFRMQLAYIMDEHTSACVVSALDKLEESLGSDLFKQIFPVILTDNGHEFIDISGMERSIYGGSRTKIFFCEPNRSDEKGACENNHKYIRYIIPKGTSMESFDQLDINLMMNHVNSFLRKELFGKSPYDVAMAVLPQDFFILLGLEKISPEDIILKPSLFFRKFQNP